MIDLTDVGRWLKNKQGMPAETKKFMAEFANMLISRLPEQTEPKYIDETIFNEKEPEAEPGKFYLPDYGLKMFDAEKPNIGFNALVKYTGIPETDGWIIQIINMDKGRVEFLKSFDELINYVHFCTLTSLRVSDMKNLVLEKDLFKNI